jgi:serine/threonine protein kinase/tetratricopeptide (TPR) repeat protein
MNLSASTPASRPTVIDEPTHIGPYRIEYELGRGGMGVVYAAQHEPTGMRVAVKTVGSIRSANLAQLRSEIFTLARLRHPGVVKILEHGICDGTPWYAMELIQGVTLHDALANWWTKERTSDRGTPGAQIATTETPQRERTTADVSSNSYDTLAVTYDDAPASYEHRTGLTRSPRAAGGNLPRALGLIRDVCDVLAYLHGEGVIHRDLKPSNVFVRENGQPVLVDFGLADQLGGRAGREIIGHSGEVMGSFPYMSPEQIQGEILDARCDLYAVGCLLYEAVTGHPPFIGNTGRVASAHLHETPLPVSSWVNEVPEELDELIAALLVKQPHRRIGYAEDIAAALDRIGAMPRSWKTELPAHRPYLYRPPFVGRSEHCERLVKRLNEVCTTDCALVFIGGESGVGKTRLALEAANHAKGIGVVITGICSTVSAGAGDPRTQDQPLRPLGPLLEAVADRWLEADPDTREQLLGSRAAVLAPYSAVLAALPGVDQLPAPVTLPVEAAKERVYEAMSETIRAFGNLCPIVLVLEDLQWSDELTLGLLEYLHRRKPKGVRCVVIGTYRSDECSDRLAKLVTSQGVEHYVVPRMSDSEVADMTGGMLNAPPGELVTFLATHSGGNPFFVAEYLRSALQSGALVRTPKGGWRMPETDASVSEICASLPAPKALQQLVELRLQRLTESTRRVLETAAIMGRRIELRPLQFAAGLDEEQLLSVIEETVRAYVWEVGPDGAYRFAHDKLRELPLAELDAQKKRLLHGEVAKAMEQAYVGPDELTPRRAEIGHHWAAANEPARAVPHLVAGGDAARDAHAIDEAIRLYEAAGQQLARAASEIEGEDYRTMRFAVDERLGDVLSFGGFHDRAREAFERALDTALPDQVTERVRILRKLAKTWEVQHEHNRAKRTYDDALAIVPVNPGELHPVLAHEWVQIVLGRAWIFYWLGRPKEMSLEIARVAEHVEERGTDLERYQYFLAVVTRDFRQHRYRVSDPTLQAGRACVVAARAAAALPEIAFGRFVLGFALLFRGELPEAETEIWAALDACRQLGDAVGETRAIAYTALLHRLQGRLLETEQVAQQTLALAEAREMGDYIGLAQACLGWAALRRGRFDEAERLGRTSLQTWNNLNFPFPFRWCGTLLLMKLLLARSSAARLEEALALGRELTAETQHKLPDPVDCPLLAAAQAADAGDIEEAHRHLDIAIACAERLGLV